LEIPKQWWGEFLSEKLGAECIIRSCGGWSIAQILDQIVFDIYNYRINKNDIVVLNTSYQRRYLIPNIYGSSGELNVMEIDDINKKINNKILVNNFGIIINWYYKTKLSYRGQVISTDFVKYLDKLYSIDGLLFKSFYNIQLIENFLKYRKLNYIFGSMNNIYENISDYHKYIDVSDNTKELIDFIKNKVEIKLKDFYSYITPENDLNGFWSSFTVGVFTDYHPRPIIHFNWIKDILMKEIDIELKINDKKIMEIESKIDTFNNRDDFNSLPDLFPKFYEKRIGYAIYL
jgi:hypothetical protein